MSGADVPRCLRRILWLLLLLGWSAAVFLFLFFSFFPFFFSYAMVDRQATEEGQGDQVGWLLEGEVQSLGNRSRRSSKLPALRNARKNECENSPGLSPGNQFSH